MDNPSLSKKRKITTNDGEMVDLSLPTVDKKKLYTVENMHFIQEDEEMRLDLIANRYYGWADRLDAILWANNIFNPFSIEANTWLIIPRVKDTTAYAVNPKVSSLPEENTQTTSSKITDAANKLNNTTEKAKTERMNKRNGKKPNELSKGQTNKRVNGATLLLG